MKKSKGNFAVLLVILFVIYNSYNNFNNKPKHYTSEPSTVQTTKTTTSSTNSIDENVDKLKKSTKKIRNDWKTSKTKAELEDKVNNYLNKFKNNNNNQSNQNEQNQTDSELANLEPEGRDSVEVNGNKSTLDFSTWTTNHIEYSPLDNLNRAGKATAYLSKINYGKSEGRESQTWRPTGWLNNQQKNKDRGHLVAYTLSFNFDEDGNLAMGKQGSLDNPKNLFTQTSQSNRGVMQQYEQLVREAIRQNKRVIYQATPIFRGDELMARGIHLQALSEDGSLDFNQYLFNTDDNYNFDYANGRSWRK